MNKSQYLIKWSAFFILTLFFLFIYECFISRISIHNIHPLFYVSLMVAPCTRSELFENLIYALFAGLLMDILNPGATPFFNIFCFVVFACISFYIRKNFLKHGLFCSLLSFLICSVLYGIFLAISLSVAHTFVFTQFLLSFLIELLLSVIFVPVIDFPYKKISDLINKLN